MSLCNPTLAGPSTIRTTEFIFLPTFVLSLLLLLLPLFFFLSVSYFLLNISAKQDGSADLEFFLSAGVCRSVANDTLEQSKPWLVQADESL